MTAEAPEAWGEVEPLETATPARGFWAALRDPVVLTGLLDAGVVLLFVAGLNVAYGLSKKLELWYAFITIAKLVLLATSWNQRAPLSGPAKWLIGSTTVIRSVATGRTSRGRRPGQFLDASVYRIPVGRAGAGIPGCRATPSGRLSARSGLTEPAAHQRGRRLRRGRVGSPAAVAGALWPGSTPETGHVFHISAAVTYGEK